MARKKLKEGEWHNFPQQDMGRWFAEWVFSRLAFKYWDKKKGRCKIKEFKYNGIREHKDGTASLLFDVRW